MWFLKFAQALTFSFSLLMCTKECLHSGYECELWLERKHVLYLLRDDETRLMYSITKQLWNWVIKYIGALCDFFLPFAKISEKN